ncbi:MAG TPA: FkbM family methyltransferase [Gammaproteobacteria bacterium]|jgi:FkbM family methyltransferase|nr:FkbM family methyltransferase [Gammaproteobacteria bacterium]
MKLKEVLYGFRLKPAPREYGYTLQDFDLAREGRVQYASWDHPKESPKRFDQDYVDVLREFLKPGDYAVDIGAHSGDTTLPMALAVGAEGGVFALEPNPHVFKVLAANAALNPGKARIFPLMFAATDVDGEYEFEYSDPGFSNGGLHQGISPWRHGHFFKLKVQGRNLLSFLEREYPQELRRIRYLKIDAEGHDPAIVRSLRTLVAANRPYLRTEVYKHLPEEARRAYFRELLEMGYTPYKFEDEKNYRGTRLRESMLMDWEHFDIFAVPG